MHFLLLSVYFYFLGSQAKNTRSRKTLECPPLISSDKSTDSREPNKSPTDPSPKTNCTTRKQSRNQRIESGYFEGYPEREAENPHQQSTRISNRRQSEGGRRTLRACASKKKGGKGNGKNREGGGKGQSELGINRGEVGAVEGTMIDFYALELVESEEDRPITSIGDPHRRFRERKRGKQIQFNPRRRAVKKRICLCLLGVRGDAQKDIQSDNPTQFPSFLFSSLASLSAWS